MVGFAASNITESEDDPWRCAALFGAVIAFNWQIPCKHSYITAF
jgi:hypothetical protein